MVHHNTEHRLGMEYQPPEEFLSREEFFGVALVNAFQEGPFSLMIVRQNNWGQYPLGVMPTIRRHMDQHVLRAVPAGSQVCRAILMNAVAAIVRIPRGDALQLARSIVASVAEQPLSVPWLQQKLTVQLSGAVYDSVSWPNPALLAFMTGDLSAAARPGEVLPPL